MRPWWGHYYHFHVRIACPPGSRGCRPQPPVPRGDGCGIELDDWFKRLRQAEIRPARPAKPVLAKAPQTLDDLPNECRTVLTIGGGSAPAPKRAAANKPAGPPPPHLQRRGEPGFPAPRPIRSIWEVEDAVIRGAGPLFSDFARKAFCGLNRTPRDSAITHLS